MFESSKKSEFAGGVDVSHVHEGNELRHNWAARGMCSIIVMYEDVFWPFAWALTLCGE